MPRSAATRAAGIRADARRRRERLAWPGWTPRPRGPVDHEARASELAEMQLRGFTHDECAREFGIHPDSLARWMQRRRHA